MFHLTLTYRTSAETGSSSVESAPIDLVGANENVSNTVDIETSDQATHNTASSSRGAQHTAATAGPSTSLR